MLTTSIDPGLAPDLAGSLTADRPRCECQHNDPGRIGRCPERAGVRVTLVCAVDGCSDAAGVYLLCRPCLSSWQRNAGAKGLKVRVRAL
jgi:hypothetical protein